MDGKPRLLITLGDVAGIGPELVARAWDDLQTVCIPTVIGDVAWMTRIDPRIPVVQATSEDLRDVQPGKVNARAGKAAYDFLCSAIDLTLAGKADGIVTLPLNKEGLHAAGLKYPGHTEILAARTGVHDFGMMLYAPPGPNVTNALGVVHVTLHMALRDVFTHLSTDAVLAKIHLLNGVLHKLCEWTPRLVVAALNPHASDGGIFGAEEARIIAPAVKRALAAGVNVVGPLPCDTLFVQAQHGRFDGVVAMYHDQGHIALKLLTGLAAVNVTLGLPIVRTSVAHGTAYDIVGKGSADPQSLLEAAKVAAKLAMCRES